MFSKTMVRLLFAAALLAPAVSVQADVFNMGGGDTSLSFVTVGDPGNVADTNGFGSVPYAYQMGTYDVTLGQYTAFLNAVYLSWPAISRSRAAKVSCIESEKLITMISGVITFKNILRLKLAHPSPPSASMIAIIGGNAATTMNDILRKKMIAMIQPARMPRIL